MRSVYKHMKRKRWMVCSQQQPRLTSFLGSSISPILVNANTLGGNWVDYGGLRSKVKVTVISNGPHAHECDITLGEVYQITNLAQLKWLGFGGQWCSLVNLNFDASLLQKCLSRSIQTNNYDSHLNWYLKKKKLACRFMTTETGYCQYVRAEGGWGWQHLR